jgi:hypothetical protein
MKNPAATLVVFTLTLGVSAFLLFLIQPLVAKMVLPLLGGTPMVWNTCLVFFQALLLAGYLYAHLMPRWLGRRLALVHVVLLTLPLWLLPVSVAGWTPPPEANPALWLLGLLLGVAGLPFFFLSTSAPLLQRWYAGLGHSASRDPYFLYAASNVGSMAALLCYPVLVEPSLTLAAQARWWAVGYGLLVALVGVCAAFVWRGPALAAEDVPADQSVVRLGQWLRWIGLALVPSSVMLGVTTHLTTDLAPIPLLWVLPLAIYLLTFILAFSRLPPLFSTLVFILLPIVVLLLVFVPMLGVALTLGEALQLHLVALFLVCMVCHGELARSRPAPAHLTGFYLCLSLGGVLGGIGNALVAPVVFDRVVEYPLMIVAAFFLVLRPWPSSPLPGFVMPAFGAAAGALLLFLTFAPGPRPVLYRERNFIGNLMVRHDPQTNTNQLAYGTTVHGVQCLDPQRRREPLAYFHRSGPVGQFFAEFNARGGGRRIGVIGLGAGTLGCYAEPGDRWTYYDLDPAVVRVASDPRYFTYLHDCRQRGVTVDVVLGDARLSLQREPGPFDLIVLDAFTSDAIPTHLMTREALRMYFERLTDHGILAFNISSRYLRLGPVLAGLAEDAGLTGLIQSDDQADPPWKVISEWALLARRAEHLGKLADDSRWQPLPSQGRARVWTDDYSHVWGAIVWGRD